MEKHSKILVCLTLSSFLFSCSSNQFAKNDSGDFENSDRSPAGAPDRRHAAPPPRRDFKKPTDNKSSANKAPGKTHLGMAGACNLDSIAGVAVGDVGVLEILPRLAKNGSVSGGPAQLTYERNSRGELVQNMIVDIRNDRALFSSYFNGGSESFNDMQVALAEAVEGSGQESHYKAVFSPKNAVHALNSAMSFINGNYMTSSIQPKRTGHVMAAALAAIMATLDYPGCAEYFVSEAGKIAGPQAASYLGDFPFQKIRDARRNHTIGSEWAALGKKRQKLSEDIETVDHLLAKSETNNDARLKQLERSLKLEIEQLKLSLRKFGPCQKVIAEESVLFNPLLKDEENAKKLVSRCRETLESKSDEISTRLLSMAAEKEILARQNTIFEQQMNLQKDDGAKKITQGKIDANVKKMESFDELSPKLELDKQLYDSYVAEFTPSEVDVDLDLKSESDEPSVEVKSSINLQLDKIASISKEARRRRSGKPFNEDHKRVMELRNDYFRVTRDYVTLGVFGGAAAAGSHSPASDDDDN